MEALLNIMRFALLSPYPIIDPLSPLDAGTLTKNEKQRGNQIAIHFLSTCSALHAEGTRYLWEQNQFVFTSPEALRRFGELNIRFRQSIKHVTLRIIARYYDDETRPQKRKIGRSYHLAVKKSHTLAVSRRPKESPLVRGGFRCYSWNQVVDFLCALRTPFNTSAGQETKPEPKLFPSIQSLRLDLVNFTEDLPYPALNLHDIACHEMACSLDELSVTGMPSDDAGVRAETELAGLLKDDGLYLDGLPTYIAVKGSLHTLPDSPRGWSSKVIRCWKHGESESSSDSEMLDDHFHHFDDLDDPRRPLGILPPANTQSDQPKGTDYIIWKNIPVSRDSNERIWTPFSRTTGHEIDIDSESDEGTNAYFETQQSGRD